MNGSPGRGFGQSMGRAGRRRAWGRIATSMFLASAAACAPARTATGGDGYLAAMPTRDMSEGLGQAFRAVKQIQVSVTYAVHFFDEADAPTVSDLGTSDATRRAVETDVSEQTSRATAVVVSRAPRTMTLLTAAHAVVRPDTLIEYFGGRAMAVEESSRRIRSLSIKTRQTNWVTGLPGSRTFDVLAADEGDDLALIGFRHLAPDGLEEAFPMAAPAGDPHALSLGAFVYVLGYPGGFPMVSGGVVTPTRDGRGSFIVDGNWNEGVSGGAVLAVTRDGQMLEWVGMARASAGEREVRFVPPAGAVEQHDPALPYQGPIYLEEGLRIQYGITLSVPMTTIRRFVDRNAAELRRLGHQVPIL